MDGLKMRWRCARLEEGFLSFGIPTSGKLRCSTACVYRFIVKVDKGGVCVGETLKLYSDGLDSKMIRL